MRSNALRAPSPATHFAALLKKTPASVRSLPVAPRLLVRDGLHAGAWVTLRGPFMRLGRNEDCDIVLTDVGVPDVAGAFVPTSTGWQLRRAVAQSRPAPEPEDASAEAPSEASEAASTIPTGALVPPESETRHARFRRRRWSLHGVTLVVIDLSAPVPAVDIQAASRFKYVAWVALVVVFVAGALLAFVFLIAPSLESKVVEARESLATAGFHDVVLRRGKGREIVLTGFVDDAASLARLRLWAQGISHLQVQLQVQDGRALAQRLRESIGESNTIMVSYQGGGRVRAEGSTPSAAVKQRIQSLVRESSNAVTIEDRVALFEPLEVAQQRPMPVRVVNAMFGETPYFQTEDGSTYTVGAVLPDASEVIAILPTRILFRANGRSIEYPLDTVRPLVKP